MFSNDSYLWDDYDYCCYDSDDVYSEEDEEYFSDVDLDTHFESLEDNEFAHKVCIQSVPMGNVTSKNCDVDIVYIL